MCGCGGTGLRDSARCWNAGAVATSGLAIVCVAAEPFWGARLLGAGLCAIACAGFVGWRAIHDPAVRREAANHWILMGGTAIATLAAFHHAALPPVRSPTLVRAVTIVTWSVAIAANLAVDVCRLAPDPRLARVFRWHVSARPLPCGRDRVDWVVDVSLVSLDRLRPLAAHRPPLSISARYSGLTTELRAPNRSFDLGRTRSGTGEIQPSDGELVARNAMAFCLLRSRLKASGSLWNASPSISTRRLRVAKHEVDLVPATIWFGFQPVIPHPQHWRTAFGG